MASHVGTAYVEVAPDARGFAEKVRAQIRDFAISVDVDTGGAQAKVAALRAELEALGKGIPAPEVPGPDVPEEEYRRKARDAGGSFGRQFSQSVREAIKSLGAPQIGVAKSEAEQKIRDLRAELTTLADQRIGVDISADEAERKIFDLRNELAELGANATSVDVRVDAAAAEAALERFSVKVSEATRNRTAHVEVDVDKSPIDRADGSLRGFQSRLGLIPALALAAGSALVPLGAALAGVGGALASVLAIGGGGVGLFAGIAGIAVAQTLKDQKANLTAATQATASHKAAVQQLQSAEDSAVAAHKAVRDAVQGLADAQRSAADQNRSAAQAVRSAEEQLAQTQRTSAQAQRDLTQARREAADEIAAMSDKLADAQLSARGAGLALEQAQQNLTKVNGTAGSTDLQKRQAQYDVDSAQQRLKEQQQQVTATQQAKAQADAQGVEGSAKVQAAEQRVADARRSQAAAARAVTEARRAQAETERAGAESVARATQQVADARAADAKAARDVAAANAAIGTAAAGAAAQTKQLSSAQQGFLTVVAGLKAAFGTLTTGRTGDALFGGLGAGVRLLTTLLPAVAPIIRVVGNALTVFFDDLNRAVKGPGFASTMGEFVRQLRRDLPLLLDIGRNVLGGLAGLFLAFGRALGGPLLDSIDRFSKRFAGIGDSPGLQRFFAYVRQVGPEVGRVLGDVAGAIGRIVVAAAPVGAVVLRVFDSLARAIRGMPTQTLTAIVVGLAGFAVLAKTLGPLVGFVTTFSKFAGLLGVSAGPLGLVIAAVVALGAAAAYAYTHFEPFRAQVQRIARVAVEQFTPALQAIRDVIVNDVIPAFQRNRRSITQLVDNLGDVAVIALRAGTFFTRYLLPPLIRVAGFIFGTVVPAMIALDNVIFGMYRDLARFAGRVGNAVGDAVGYFFRLPGQITRILGGLGDTLYNAGKNLMQMLAMGIAASAGSVWKAARDVVTGIAKLVPGSPVREGPLLAFNNGRTGRALMDMLAGGIIDGAPDVHGAMRASLAGLADVTGGEAWRPNVSVPGGLAPVAAGSVPAGGGLVASAPFVVQMDTREVVRGMLTLKRTNGGLELGLS